MTLQKFFRSLLILGTFGAATSLTMAQHSLSSAADSNVEAIRLPASESAMVMQTAATSLVLRETDDSTASPKPTPTTSATTQQASAKMTKSPGAAIIRSLVCPGWGQLYDENYMRSALFFGATAAVSGILLWNNAKYLNADLTYSSSGISDIQKQQAYSEREFYRDQRDVSGLWLLGIYTLSAIDAYVGAHLYDFDVSDSGLSLLPTVGPTGPSLCASIRF